ncbi:MAG: hypothetical protein CVU47_08615 [Chloroflexi bacterium HGW-Chloroflexi-9]|nr:MAG: hypothetical protein CVU47_08615 [Chloroflexi bacterium HGW-Chloroflexi-9]
MPDTPVLRSFYTVHGCYSPEEFRTAQAANTLVGISGAQVAERDIGDFNFEFTVVAYWQGARGPWEFALRATEEHLFGKPSPEFALDWRSVHTFPPGNPDFAMLKAVSMTVTTYGRIFAVAYCNGTETQRQELRIIPPQTEIDARR